MMKLISSSFNLRRSELYREVSGVDTILNITTVDGQPLSGVDEVSGTESLNSVNIKWDEEQSDFFRSMTLGGSFRCMIMNIS